MRRGKRRLQGRRKSIGYGEIRGHAGEGLAKADIGYVDPDGGSAPILPVHAWRGEGRPFGGFTDVP